MTEWRHLKGKRVVVTANGVEYRGTVVELGESSLSLCSAAGHREIPWERVTRVREEGERSALRGPSILG